MAADLSAAAGDDRRERDARRTYYSISADDYSGRVEVDFRLTDSNGYPCQHFTIRVGDLYASFGRVAALELLHALETAIESARDVTG